MSLDVYLELPGKSGEVRTAIFVREEGRIIEISREEWDRRHPGKEPSTVRVGGDKTVYTGNITGNLIPMANAASIYNHLWRPEEVPALQASDLIGPLTDGLVALRTDPEKFKKLNPENGWGDYEGLVEFVQEYLGACMANPDAVIRVSR